ncbi:GyrI-like domain-containing protein [Ornithinimicrobium avium]|uniref:AraC family transcriptional regulator n=1 Tax=Ornithinimicrobium avium TaxID=2283195 RepID=A0A345NL31_9MICO|nr:GyrI-like domain-containing protein [Ornithinimicrobium avium]AXH95739.1 AraC family transcriptional regulator [Ornithinimicrobium avium]
MSAQPEIVDLEPTPTVAVRGTVTMAELRDFYDRSFGTVAKAVAQQGITPSAAYGLFLAPPADGVELEVGMLVNGAFEVDGDVTPSSLPGGRAAHLVHTGPYDDLPASWQRLTTWVDEQGLTPAGPMWEVYVTEPTPESDPATLRTDLFCSLA